MINSILLSTTKNTTFFMKKERINVPFGIRFISEWENFSIPNHPCIIDKKIPGCGFTEYCITNNENVILCSPRKLLLENKEDQHSNDVLYVKNDLDQDESIDKDLSKITRGSGLLPTRLDSLASQEQKASIINNLKTQILNYCQVCQNSGKAVKILVTYDSFRLVKEVLRKAQLLDSFRIIIDEFQSIFTDSRFKSDTELEFIYHLYDLQKVCFVSATPMIDDYLEQLPEFKDLPYYELDWEALDPLRVLKPDLLVKTCRSVNEPAYEIIKTYLSGQFESMSFKNSLGEVVTVYSKECVIYVNSVANILGIISKCELKPEQCNILIARTPDNEKRLVKKLGKAWSIGRIPKKGEPHKMFTFCTRTVYLGADFYSTSARTFILSDSSIETLAVDISLDLPQILGRQRNNDNPWKNRAEFYYKTTKTLKTRKEFEEYINLKLKKTKELLENYDSAPNKHTLAETYKKVTISENYKDNYIAINEHSGKDMFPELNRLVLIAERRSFDIQQVDYKDRFSVFSTLCQKKFIPSGNHIKEFLKRFEECTVFSEKLKMLCEESFTESELDVVLDQIPISYKNYYDTLGVSRCKSLRYRKCDLEKELSVQVQTFEDNNLGSEIYQEFIPDQKYSLKEVKEKLKKIYDKYNYKKSPKATDILNYFSIKKIKILDDSCGKRVDGFQILQRT